MKPYLALFILLFASGLYTVFGQAGYSQIPKGKLFIIGGGARPASLIKSMIETAELGANDYIVVLPMSSAEPDTSFFYIRRDLEKFCKNAIVNMNFTKPAVTKQPWLDSLKKARLIFFTGGDQNRFMEVVLHTPVHEILKAAYEAGATIAGTSAGAAIMSEKMITGNEYSGDSVRSGTFRKIAYHQVEIKQGLGLLNNAIIDQHFITRSRYNRLLSVLAEHPTLPCIGIDEATAIIVSGKKVTVTGMGQVIKLSAPPGAPLLKRQDATLVHLKNINLDILIAGDEFILP